MSEPEDKKIIGGFRVLREIQVGSGSQGTVYKAVCEIDKFGIVDPGTVVALKVMAVQDDGKQHWRKLETRTAELRRLTLNSSPYGLPFYLHAGFLPADEEKTINGIRFTAMTYDL